MGPFRGVVSPRTCGAPRPFPWRVPGFERPAADDDGRQQLARLGVSRFRSAVASARRGIAGLAGQLPDEPGVERYYVTTGFIWSSSSVTGAGSRACVILSSPAPGVGDNAAPDPPRGEGDALDRDLAAVGLEALDRDLVSHRPRLAQGRSRPCSRLRRGPRGACARRGARPAVPARTPASSAEGPGYCFHATRRHVGRWPSVLLYAKGGAGQAPDERLAARPTEQRADAQSVAPRQLLSREAGVSPCAPARRPERA